MPMKCSVQEGIAKSSELRHERRPVGAIKIGGRPYWASEGQEG